MTTATVTRIKSSYPRPATVCANDENNRPTGSTAALAICLVLSPFLLIGLFKLVAYFIH